MNQFVRRFTSASFSKLAHGKSVPALSLYQYKICPSCNKVKSLFDYLNLPYKQVEVDPLSKKQISFSTDYRKVPILKMDEEQVNDSNAIIDRVLERMRELELLDEKDLNQLREGARGKAVVEEWTTFADKQLAVLMYPNLCASFSSASTAFGYAYTVDSFSFARKVLIHVLGTLAARAGSGRLKKKYNIVNEREELRAVVAKWASHLGEAQYHGGEQPDMADLCVFGVIRSVEGHPMHTDLLATTDIGPWYEAMTKATSTTTNEEN